MHNIIHWTYPENCNRKAVQAEADEYAACEDWQEGCSGLDRPIRWLENEPVCNSYDEAVRKIETLDRGWYDCLAIRYKRLKKEAGTKSVVNAKEKADKTAADSKTLAIKLEKEFFGCTSAFVGCKSCGSKLNRKLLSHAKCPVCGASLLSDTARNRIKNAQNKAAKASQDYRAAVDRAKEKSSACDIMWLVKFEYHT